MKILITALFIISAGLPATLAQSNQSMDFLGIEIGADWQSVSNQYPEAKLSNFFLHMVKYDAPFKLYSIQVNNSEHPTFTNAEVSVYQDTVVHADFRFLVPNKVDFSRIKEKILKGATYYPCITYDSALSEHQPFQFTNFPRRIVGSLSYDGKEKAVQMDVGFDDYQAIESPWLIEPDYETE